MEEKRRGGPPSGLDLGVDSIADAAGDGAPPVLLNQDFTGDGRDEKRVHLRGGPEERRDKQPGGV